MEDRHAVAIAANNGDIGGGEVMLLNIADALRSLGIRVTVVGPSSPAELIDEARSRGFETVALNAANRRAYMAALARWRVRNSQIPLWCNGLVPSVATMCLGPRVVHLHVVPTRAQRWLAPLARLRARRIFVPSRYLSAQFPRSTVLENWTVELSPTQPRTVPRDDGPLRIGFIGRHSRDKGLDVLLRALDLVPEHRGREIRLVLAGDARFGSDADRNAIERAAASVEHRVDRIGWVDRTEFFADIDLAVFPSVARETFGLVAAEAMASGVPLVVSADGALQEVVGPEHPWTAKVGDVEDLARSIRVALDAILDGSAQQHTELARARWARRFSPSAGRRRVADALISMAKGTV